ncbi:acyltransferase family protein [Kinneretia asaccharophila]|uniref:Peptidoglycan/LPS O-acetylase OafA/YrhL n=1 Tax=Roseateles asaccharophilus TaxID=582607 RepID=A0A4R6N9Y7_9BURK|nr:acyltransferase family protein [Roseateles asaccharophilus]MDN3544911.1 acyltransferase family protein [Roseateles asaccharophilus]TDP12703.1 peptidoglycan/LPS O-acetylase OafA/YrhL [Roseateles asaccharophilus]
MNARALPSAFPTRPPARRLLHLDAMKALAAQLIVLHHLAAYGPIAETVQTLWPALIAWLYEYGRMAVQVFLVVGGFLSARALAPAGRPLQGRPLELLWRRYLRLVLPFFAAVLLTLACSALVAPLLPELVPASVSAPQLLAHALLLHDVLGYEALTVGAWYVAMDLQLFALMLALLWLARACGPAARWLGPVLLLLVCAASLYLFNRDAGLDIWAPYFFGAYGLGALMHWLCLSARPGLGLSLLGLLALGALMLDFRERLLLALLTAGLLFWLQRRHEQGRAAVLLRGPLAGAVAHLGTHSYALFLVHFPICLLLNALFEHRDPEHPWAAVAAMLAAWGLSNLAALPFYRWIEAPAGRLRLGWARTQEA